MRRYMIAALLLAGGACSTAVPLEEKCLRCAEIDERAEEGLLCEESFFGSWEPKLQCRCAPASPCAGSCPKWCGGGELESSCVSCSSAMCAEQEAKCAGDRWGP